MKPYGLPRFKEREAPDLVDIFRFALKSSTGRKPNKERESKNSIRSSKVKRRNRRLWKKKERRLAKQEAFEIKRVQSF